MRHAGRQPPIGIVAGWGNFPVSVVRRLRALDREVVCVAIAGHASKELESLCDQVLWSGVGRFGKHLRFFRKHHVEQVTLAGKVFKHEILYSGNLFLKHFPDLTCFRTFAPCLLGRRRDARDDQLLTAIIDTYQSNGFHIASATDLAPELLVKAGTLTTRSPRGRVENDIQIGWQIAKSMGGMDIGQAITIKDGTVIAVEAIEGTDACIERTGQLCRRGGWTLVKVSKPDQDMRFDVPTVGVRTVKNVADAGGTAIVIEADKTILLDRDETVELANRLGIAIIALSSDEIDVARVA